MNETGALRVQEGRIPLLELRNITKVFPGGVVALDEVSLELDGGEIHALLGENGAGKTTLVNVLYGYFHPDAGEIFLEGKRISVASPRDAINLGIGMVHQHFTLVPTLTVTQNVILGNEPQRGPFIDLAGSRDRVRELAEKYGLAVDPDAEVGRLTAGEKQRVEILKALYRNARILTLDEPTVSLTPKETDALMETVETSVKNERITVIFITHKLPEALGVSDKITVLRKGRVVDTIAASQATQQSLARMMVGKDVVFEIRREAREVGEEVLRVEGLSAMSDKGTEALKGVSFSLHAGEILGIAGVSGNGQSELSQTVMGLRQATRGSVFALGKDVTNNRTEETILHGVGYIPEDRKKEGTIANFSLVKNLVLNIHTLLQFAVKRRYLLGLPSIRWGGVRQHADRMIDEYGIVCHDRESLASHLSGGNLQKCILAREISRNPKILIAQNPSKGLDVGAMEFVGRKLLEQRERQMGIILISEDLDEVMRVSDRIAVMHEGRIVGIVPADGASRERIGLMMSGASK